MVMLQSGPFCAEVVRDINILRPELIFLKKFLPFILWAVFQKRTIYNGISMIYTVLFLKNRPPFMADAIAISPFTSPLPHQWCKKYHDRHGILSDCPYFLQQKTPFLKFWKTNLRFSNKKKKLPLSALPYPSPLQR